MRDGGERESEGLPWISVQVVRTGTEQKAERAGGQMERTSCCCRGAAEWSGGGTRCSERRAMESLLVLSVVTKPGQSQPVEGYCVQLGSCLVLGGTGPW